MGWILELNTLGTGEFGLRVYWCGDQLAIGHTGTLKKILGILTLAEEEPDGLDEGGKPEVPCARCLLQAVEGLGEEAHILGPRGVDEAGRLLAVHLFAELTM